MTTAGMVCILCHFEVEPDDVVVGSASGRVICVRCYARETGNDHPVPKGLRQAMETELAGIAPSNWLKDG